MSDLNFKQEQMSNPRFKALELIQNRPLPPAPEQSAEMSDIFGKNVFSLEVMEKYLSEDVFKDLKKQIEKGGTLSRDIADKVANGMKIWALENGATHYTHWFQPLTGQTAEKHDAFLDLKNGKPVETFSGSSLAQAEPDASSLPSGGIRNTFEARGYTAWDPGSPAFIFGNRYGKTLCIPTIFVSYTGEALDYKAPLLRSINAIEEAAVNVCRLFDRNVTRVFPTLGVEQEYFLVDRAFVDLRPDLRITGRSVLGAAPARGQELDDHYFGSIPIRVFGFMKELERECYELGIPNKTRHNEVAPSQFETAPIFEEQNVAVDHNQLLMDLIDRVAEKHNFACLLHEKPFAGINGSGKHCNWSLGTNTGKNLLSPGSNPKENLQFLTFFVNTIKAVHEHADLMRASIASAANDHRLGANEAPPAIISVFIGSQLDRILNEIEKPSRKKNKDTGKAFMKLGVSQVPEILLDNTDRNRTSPFAFTGNKFEFRAVGSSQNTAGPLTVLNTIVAKQLVEFKKTVDRKTTRGKKKEQAMLEVLRDYIKTSKAIRFEGDGYSKEWEDEAATRGLSNVKTTPRALDAYVTPESINLFSEMGVFSEVEVKARHEIKLEMYSRKISIEAKVLTDLALNHAIPAAIKYQNVLLENIEGMKDIKMPAENYAVQQEIVTNISNLVGKAYQKIGEAKAEMKALHESEGAREEAIAFCEVVIPILNELRAEIDGLETVVADEYWPLPKYREMLFIR